MLAEEKHVGHVAGVAAQVVVRRSAALMMMMVTVGVRPLAMSGFLTGRLLAGISRRHPSEVDVGVDNAQQQAGRCQHDHDYDADRQQ